jgi:hypothetical protein
MTKSSSAALFKRRFGADLLDQIDAAGFAISVKRKHSDWAKYLKKKCATYKNTEKVKTPAKFGKTIKQLAKLWKDLKDDKDGPE